MKVGGTFKGWKDMEIPLGQEKAGKLCFVMNSATFCTFHAEIRTKKTRRFFFLKILHYTERTFTIPSN